MVVVKNTKRGGEMLEHKGMAYKFAYMSNCCNTWRCTIPTCPVSVQTAFEHAGYLKYSRITIPSTKINLKQTQI